jgi:5'-3' exonuclease, N-terminal resolvase-like domain
MSKRDLLQWRAGERVAQIDADVMMYSCAFAAQKSYWNHPEFKLGSFEGKRMMNDWCEANGHNKLDGVEDVVSEPFHHAKRAFDMMHKKIVKDSEADRAILYISGDRNFRFEVAPDYKANRKHVAKPFHYARLKEHIVSQPNCIVVNGMEADDALGIAQVANHNKCGSSQWSVICTIDKDLDMIRGMHYNWQKNDLYFQAGADADRCFYRQLCMGDATDNIKGIPKVGKVKAAAIVPDTVTHAWSMYLMVRDAYRHHVAAEAANAGKVIGTGNRNERADKLLEHNAHLLWIMRDARTHWKPPTKPEITV